MMRICYRMPGKDVGTYRYPVREDSLLLCTFFSGERNGPSMWIPAIKAWLLSSGISRVDAKAVSNWFSGKVMEVGQKLLRRRNEDILQFLKVLPRCRH